MSIFDTCPSRRDSTSLKWDLYRGTDIEPYWVADMDFAAPAPVVAAMQARAAHGVYGYSEEYYGSREAVQHYLQGNYDWQIECDWIVWTHGVGSGLNLSCRAVCKPEDEVLVFTPIYPPFLNAPRFSGMQTKEVRLSRHGRSWDIDWQALDAAYTPGRTRLLLLCNPHNPVGRVFSPADLQRLHDWCVERNVIICSDEIHCDLILDANISHTPLASLGVEHCANTITLMAASKTYNIPGLGCGIAIISNPQLRERFVQAAAGITPRINAFGTLGTKIAFEECEQWRQDLLEYLRGNRDLTLAALRAMPGLQATEPIEATYLAWIDLSGSPLRTSATAKTFFEQKAKVGMSCGIPFGDAEHLRFNFACPRAQLEGALLRMQEAWATLKV